jgi:transposase
LRLHRWLVSWGIENRVVDPSSIEMNRRKRRRKTDGFDLRSLLPLLVPWALGEEDVWKLV